MKIDKVTRAQLDDMIEHWEKFAKCFFWSPPGRAIARRAEEMRHYRDIDFMVDGQWVNYRVEVSCSCKNYYCTRTLTVNDEKKAQGLRYLKKLQKHGEFVWPPFLMDGMLTAKRHLLTDRVVYCQRVPLLSRADLSRADLSGANLSEANLYGADLPRADLSEANLSKSSLSGANLSGADLSEANLPGADLYETCLDPNATMEKPTPAEISNAGLTDDGIHIYGYRTAESRFRGNTTYTPGLHKAPYFSVDRNTFCHPGIYFASREWLRNNNYEGKIVRCRARIDETVHAGNKWRAKRIWVLNEGIDKWEN